MELTVYTSELLWALNEIILANCWALAIAHQCLVTAVDRSGFSDVQNGVVKAECWTISQDTKYWSPSSSTSSTAQILGEYSCPFWVWSAPPGIWKYFRGYCGREWWELSSWVPTLIWSACTYKVLCVQATLSIECHRHCAQCLPALRGLWTCLGTEKNQLKNMKIKLCNWNIEITSTNAIYKVVKCSSIQCM